MKVASRRKINQDKKKRITSHSTKRSHPKFGTSKLEVDFARDFLDKLGVKYIWQFEAKDIGRFFDYAVILGEKNEYVNGNIVLIEIDGSYFHSDPRLIKEEDMNPMQKRNKRIDELKNKWALMHGIPIIRIWEKDIRDTPSEVMKKLKEVLNVEEVKHEKKNNKAKRHVNKLKNK